MACVQNNTARLFNLKAIDPKDGSLVVVRLSPMFNLVDDEHWNAFVSTDGKRVNPYVAKLIAAGSISVGPQIDDLELEKDPETKTLSKKVPSTKRTAKK